MKHVMVVVMLCFSIVNAGADDADCTGVPAAFADMVREIVEIENILTARDVMFDAEKVGAAVVDSLIKAVDPKAVILSEDSAQRMAEEERGISYGLGLRIQKRRSRPVVVEVDVESPAYDSGLREGDILEMIDGKCTEAMPLTGVDRILRGQRGEIVELGVRRDDEAPELRTVEVVRDLVMMPDTGVIEEWPFRIGYIQVNGLYENSGEQLVAQIEIWSKADYSGVILDVREARGSDLHSAADVAGMFAEPGELLFSVLDGRGSTIADYVAESDARASMPLMALVSRGTAYASEALSAALRGRAGVLLIGMPTAGDDRIREAVPLSDGRSLHIATMHVQPASGVSYRDNGVLPDIPVSERDAARTFEVFEPEEEPGIFPVWSPNERDNRALMSRVENDPILGRAADILLGIKALNDRIK